MRLRPLPGLLESLSSLQLFSIWPFMSDSSELSSEEQEFSNVFSRSAPFSRSLPSTACFSLLISISSSTMIENTLVSGQFGHVPKYCGGSW